MKYKVLFGTGTVTAVKYFEAESKDQAASLAFDYLYGESELFINSEKEDGTDTGLYVAARAIQMFLVE